MVKSHKSDTATIEEVSWRSVSQRVKEVAYDLYEIINRLELTSHHRIYKVRYPYGAMIIGKDGICNLPDNKGALVPITDSSIPKKVKEDLSYNWNGIPMSLILSGQVELFVEDDLRKVEIFGAYKTGVMLASRGGLDNGRSYQARNFWRMTSGSRTLFSLASINDAASFRRLKKYFNLSIDKEEAKQDVWLLFAELANSVAFPAVWYSEHLFFSREWFKQPKDDSWAAFRLALFERSWKVAAYEKNAGIVNRIWNLFRSNKKMSEYSFQMLKYSIEASLGQAFLYKPIDDSDTAGPFTTFRNILLDIYGLKKYAPIIMIADFFNFQHDCSGYVSIQKPCKLMINSRSAYKENLIVEAREIRKAIKTFVDEMKEGIIKINDTPFYDLRSINFDFYHSDKDINNEFYSSSEIFAEDIAVQKLIDPIPNKEIPFRNDLLRSCIKIYRKNKN